MVDASECMLTLERRDILDGEREDVRRGVALRWLGDGEKRGRDDVAPRDDATSDSPRGGGRMLPPVLAGTRRSGIGERVGVRAWSVEAENRGVPGALDDNLWLDQWDMGWHSLSLAARCDDLARSSGDPGGEYISSDSRTEWPAEE